jgi:serine protease Do
MILQTKSVNPDCILIGTIPKQGRNFAALQFWRTGLGLALVCVFTAPATLEAEKGSAQKKSKNKPVAEAIESKEKSIEALTALARQSVVIVSRSGRDGAEEGVGAGFIVSTNGLIATCLHVIGEARPITVRLANGKKYEASEIYAWDRKLDLAIIRIEAGSLSALPLGDSDNLKQGASVLAMGNPLGLDHSVVQGIVSGRRSFLQSEMIQLAIPVEPGNSGGPLLDLQGQVEGILTLKSALTPNLGFAMPVNDLKPLLQKPNPVPIQRWLSIGQLNPEEWKPLFGARWSQKTGRIQVEGSGAGFGGRTLCLSQKTIPEPPFEVAVTVRLDDETGAAGLVFGSDGDQKHYGFYPSSGQLRLTRFNGSNVLSWTILDQVESAHYRPGEWNTLKVRVDSDKIRCYVNDNMVIESSDVKLAGDKVGLAKFRDTRAMFKDFQFGRRLAVSNSAPSKELEAAVVRRLEELADKPDADLIAALPSLGEAGQSILAERARNLEQEAARLRKLVVAINRQAVQTELIKLFAAPEPEIDLFYAALLVAKLDDASLAIEPYRQQLLDISREILLGLPAEADEQTRLNALINYLFKENGFPGSRNDYYNRANSYLNEVLDEREGLPISLSVLFIELAHRIGLKTVEGVGLPGHFVVEHFPKEGQAQLIDVFDGGKTLSREDANEMARAYTGAPLRQDQLQPATKREIILRMLRNLLGIAQNNEPAADSLRYLDLIVALAPDPGKDRLHRARIRLQSGDRVGAKQDFKWLIEHEPDWVDLEQIGEIYRSL